MIVEWDSQESTFNESAITVTKGLVEWAKCPGHLGTSRASAVDRWKSIIAFNFPNPPMCGDEGADTKDTKESEEREPHIVAVAILEGRRSSSF